MVTVKGQSDVVIQRLMERLDETTTLDSEELEQQLYRLLANPIRINEADEEELRRLFFLSPYQINQIIEFRGQHGDFQALNELLLVSGITQNDYNDLSPFLILIPSQVRKYERISSPLNGMVLARSGIKLPHKEGFMRYSREEVGDDQHYEQIEESRFQGIPVSLLLRFQLYQNMHWEIGGTLESDSGERYFGNDRPLGFDFISLYGRYEGQGFLKMLLLGDFRVKWGEGTLLWSGYSFGGSIRDNIWPKDGIIPYRSSNESCFFRGVATTFRLHSRITWDFIASFKKPDGRYYFLDSVCLASVSEVGLHRNRREEAIRHRVKEYVVGSRLEFNTPWFRLGMMGMFYHFSPELYRFPSRSYWREEDHGSRRLLGGGYCRTSFGNLFISSEAVYSTSLAVEKEPVLKKDLAYLFSLVYSGASFAFRLLGRHYGNSYQARYAGGFSAYNGVGNEEGLFASCEWQLPKRWSWQWSGDYYRSLRPRYRITNPAWSYDFRTCLRYEDKMNSGELRGVFWNECEDGERYETYSKCKQELRIRYRRQCCDYFSIGGQLSGVHFKKESEKQWGLLASLRGEYQFHQERIRLAMVLSYATTDGYESRLYVSEPSLQYMHGFSMLYNRTYRAALRICSRMGHRFDLQLKSDFSYYPDRESTGSGVERIVGKLRINGVVQLLYKW